MLKNYIKVAVRFLIKDKIFSFINLLGFTLSISFALLIILWVISEFSYEKSFNDADRIYRVVEVAKQNDMIEKRANTYLQLADELKKTFPFINDAGFVKYESPRILHYNENKIEAKSGYIDDTFLDVVDFEFVEGSPKVFYSKSNAIILTDKVARKLFGNEKALGKVLVNKFYSQNNLYEVAGVIKMPDYTHFSFEIILNFNEIKGWYVGREWKSESFTNYIKIRENTNITKAQQLELSNFLSNYVNTNSKLWFQPILDIHLHQDFEYRYDNNLGNNKIILLNILLVLLLLAIAVFNFINLNLSRSTNRYKEIAIRKIVGASRKRLIFQFFSETILQSVIAVYVGVIFAELLRPVFNNILNISIEIPYQPTMFLILMVSGIVLGLISGSYPAMFLSKLSPVLIFSQKSPKSFNSKLIKVLSVCQFTITTAVFIIGIFIFKQLNYIQNADLGIEKENILIMETGLWYGSEAFIHELENNQGVISATSVTNSPDDFFWQNKNVTWDGKETEGNVIMNKVWVDDGFWDTYKVKLLEGELYTTNFEAYWNGEPPYKIVINETAKRIIGKENVIGTIIRDGWDYIVVGVVKDFHFKSLHKAITPLIMTYSPEAIQEIDIRIKPENRKETIDFIKETYLKHRPERVFNYKYFDDMLAQKYQNEKRLSRIISWFLLFALIIALSGIIGMVVYSIAKRSKEIAIRKVNGASFSNILILLGKEYLVNLIAAFVLSSIIVSYIISNWLNNFAYHIGFNISNYIIPFLVMIVLSLLAIIILLNILVRKNPVESLRYE